MAGHLLGRILSTGDVSLAAALLTHGVDFDEDRGGWCKIKTDRRDYASFRFQPVSLDGEYQTVNLMEHWRRGEEQNFNEPRAGMTWISRYERNKRELLEVVKQGREKVVLRNGPALAIVDPYGEPVVRDQILRKIGI